MSLQRVSDKQKLDRLKLYIYLRFSYFLNPVILSVFVKPAPSPLEILVHENNIMSHRFGFSLKKSNIFV